MFPFALIAGLAIAQEPVETEVSAGAIVAMDGGAEYGFEAALRGPLFVRGRLLTFRMPSPELALALESIAQEWDARPWLGWGARLEAGWEPMPELRATLVVNSRLAFPAGAQRRLEDQGRVTVDTVGATRLGPSVAAGPKGENWELKAVGTLRVPIASRWGDPSLRPMKQDGSLYRQSEMQGGMLGAWVEGRALFGPAYAQIEAGLKSHAPSRYRRELVIANALLPEPTAVQDPFVTVSFGGVFD